MFEYYSVLLSRCVESPLSLTIIIKAPCAASPAHTCELRNKMAARIALSLLVVPCARYSTRCIFLRGLCSVSSAQLSLAPEESQPKPRSLQHEKYRSPASVLRAKRLSIGEKRRRNSESVVSEEEKTGPVSEVKKTRKKAEKHYVGTKIEPRVKRAKEKKDNENYASAEKVKAELVSEARRAEGRKDKQRSVGTEEPGANLVSEVKRAKDVRGKQHYSHFERGLLRRGSEERGGANKEEDEASLVARNDSLPVQEVHQLVNHVEHHAGVDKSDLALFSHAHINPSPLGVSPSDIDSITEELCAAGFTRKEVGSVLPYLAPALRVDLCKLHQVRQFLFCFLVSQPPQQPVPSSLLFLSYFPPPTSHSPPPPSPLSPPLLSPSPPPSPPSPPPNNTYS